MNETSLAGGNPKRVLEPVERVSEVLFGLIMVLTFTGSLSVADAGRDDVRAMLIGALGCNLAWGIIDAIFYLMGCLGERGNELRMRHAVLKTDNPQQARTLIANELPAVVATVLQPAEYESIHQRIRDLPAPEQQARLTASNWKGAVGVFLLVFLSTFPVSVPFMFMEDLSTAMRTSNAIAVVMLFICGVVYSRCVGGTGWKFGLSMVLLGLALVAMTIALGG